MDKRQDLIKLSTILQNIDRTVFENMASESIRIFEILIANITSISETIQIPDVWDNDISTEINGTTIKGLDQMIETCKKPIEPVMIPTGKNIDSLKSCIEMYKRKVDEYNTKENELKNLGTLGTQPSQTKENEDGEIVHNDLYDNWIQKRDKIESLNGVLATLKLEANTYEQEADDLITTLRGLLSPIGSKESEAALKASNNEIGEYTRSATDFGYDPSYKVSGTVRKDANGNIVFESYTITDLYGNVVQTGTITYNEDGSRSAEQYIKKFEDPTDINAAKEDAKAQGLPELDAYLDEDTVPVEEEHDTEIEYTEDEDGTDYSKKDEFSKKFEDGATMDGTEIENGSVDADGDLIPEEGTVDFTLTTSEGETFDGHTEKTYANGQLKIETTTLSQDGDTVLTKENTNVADYEDSLLGYNVDVNNTEVTADGKNVVIRTSIFTGNEGTLSEESVTIARSVDDPQCGYVINPNGERYDYTRDENGNLVETHSYKDKHGNTQTEQSIIGEDYATLTTTNHTTGNVVSQQINVNSQLDITLTTVSYQNNQMEAGYKAEAASDGQQNLFIGDGEVSIYSPFGDDPLYTMKIDYNGTN